MIGSGEKRILSKGIESHKNTQPIPFS